MQLTVVFFLTVVVAQVAYLLFITLEVLSSNPAIRNIKNNVCLFILTVEKAKIKKKRPVMAH